MLEVGHADSLGVKDDAIAAGYWDPKVLKQLYDLLITRLHPLLEEDEDKFIDLVNDIINRRLCQVFEWL